jgi:hypothetical protein
VCAAVCAWANVESAYPTIVANPDVALAEYACGAHGCKFGLLGLDSVAHELIGEFVHASWRELRRAHGEAYPVGEQEG